MSFKRNVAANYASFGYLALIAAVMVPVYVDRMGTEAYGLVSFFVVLQTVFQLLDLGLTPALSREAARFLGGATSALGFRQLLRSLVIVFGAVAGAGAILVTILSGWMASRWLRVESLPISEIETALRIMALVAASRWLSGLFRGVINGFEQQVWLAGFNVLMATASFVLVVPVLDAFGATPIVFFTYQAIIALIELGVLSAKTYRALPPVPRGTEMRPSFHSLRGILHFSLSIAFTSTLWIAISNLDKLLLSKFLTLSDYAIFSIATLLASAVMVVSNPIRAALMPRMAKLSAEGDDHGLIRLYRDATQVITLAVTPVCVMFALFPQNILWAWTESRDIAIRGESVLMAYAIGNAFIGIGAAAYYLQFAKGQLRLHVLGSFFFALILVPLMIWGSIRFGPIGAGAAWIAASAIYFFAWIPLIHRQFSHGLHVSWVVVDVLSPIFPALVGGYALKELLRFPDDRIATAAILLLAGFLVFLFACAGSSLIRREISGRIRRG